jgi:alpha-ketoglutarate-dependent taurine dioxygenase
VSEVVPDTHAGRTGDAITRSRSGGADVFRFAVDDAAFLVGERAEPPAHPAVIRGRPRLAGSDSPLAPRTLAPAPQGFPLVARLDPAGPDLELSHWSRAARKLLDAHLEGVGAVLLRGLPLPHVEAFSSFVIGLGYEMMRYSSSLAARREVATNVMNANEAPPHKTIPLHNEMSFERPSPRHLFLFCDRAPGPGEGGETPIARNEDWERELGEPLISKLEERGLVRSVHYPDIGDAKRPGLSWQSHFRSHDRGEVEQRCRERGLEPLWRDDGRLTTRCEQPVTIELDGRRRWFCAPHASRPMTPVELTYRDGEALEAELMERLRALQWNLAVVFAWQRGDVLCLDNLRCQHGRLSYETDSGRRNFVAIASPFGARDDTRVLP